MSPDHHHHHHQHHGPAEYRFCPRCGGELMRRQIKSGEPERLVCAKCFFIFYLDPKVVAATIVATEGGIVLLRRGIEPALGKWVFPGGYVDRGESVTDAALREAKEESNLDVALEKLLGVYSYPSSPNIIIVYTSRVTGGQLRAADESIEASVFPSSSIPWDDLAFDSTKEALEDFLRLYAVDPV